MSGVMIKTGLVGVNDNDILYEMTANAENFEAWILGSTAGAMDVFVSGDGTNYLAAAIALTDLGAAASTTKVLLTAAGGHYRLEGRWKKIKFMQNAATAVANGYVIGISAER